MGSDSPPRWLDANQQAAWRTLVSVVTRLPAALDTQTQRDSDLTHFEYFTLAQLSESPGRAPVVRSRGVHEFVVVAPVARDHPPDQTRLGLPGADPGQPRLLRGAHRRGLREVAEAAPAHVESVRQLVFDGLDDHQVRLLTELGAVLVAQLDKGLAAGDREGVTIRHRRGGA